MFSFSYQANQANQANSFGVFGPRVRVDNYDEKSIDSSPMFQNNFNNDNINIDNKYADDWSHTIYLYNIKNADSGLKGITKLKTYESWNGKNPLQLDKIDFDFDKLSYFDKLEIVGTHANKDIVIAVN
jgi:hypothetical protein